MKCHFRANLKCHFRANLKCRFQANLKLWCGSAFCVGGEFLSNSTCFSKKFIAGCRSPLHGDKLQKLELVLSHDCCLANLGFTKTKFQNVTPAPFAYTYANPMIGAGKKCGFSLHGFMASGPVLGVCGGVQPPHPPVRVYAT